MNKNLRTFLLTSPTSKFNSHAGYRNIRRKWVKKRIGYLGGRLYKEFVPLYNSDYLLEKLPDGTTIMKDVQGFKAWNIYNRKRITTYTCDSPVEALIKLTIALSEAGELKNDQSS